MKHDEMIAQARKLCAPFKVEQGGKFRLKAVDPGDTLWLKAEDKARSKEMLAKGVELMAELQDKLYAQDTYSVLLIFQAMDAAGKDGAIKHVMSGINPQGCQVHPFKVPSHDDLEHDFMWRCWRLLPNRGNIGIFNRSYYEEVLVVRVHPEHLERQKLPPGLVTGDIWRQRHRDIAQFEDYLTRNGTVVRKFFLHLSKKEQKKRFLARLETPEKQWKFEAGDLRERGFWNDYMAAYEDMIRHTATKAAPWYVIPADNKWFTRIVVASAIIETLQDLKLAYPKVSKAKQQEIAEAKAALAR
ncbi:MAG TPA: polyphosphate kinase 2 family protein [Clostridia bacterium]|nr:polyphosphate kinase 2 family protein [Clostridia bacterium]